MSKITSIGGQALIEGVMMAGPFKTVAAFCDTDGNITTEEIHSEPMRKKHPILGKPFIRGVFSFIDSMRTGIKALELSADKACGPEEEEPSGFDKWLTDKLGDKATGILMSIASVLGVLLAVVLFIMLPTLVFNGIEYFAGSAIEPFRSVAEGVMKLIIFILYIYLISLTPDIKRVFMYHGAEHKSIFCYENDLELTVENVKKQRRFHPRCGTSFMIIIIILGIIVGTFIPATNPVVRTLLKLLTLPIVMSIGYELIKLCGRHDNVITRIIAAPGLWMQRITTKEPDDKMMETAIAALKAVIPENGEDILK